MAKRRHAPERPGTRRSKRPTPAAPARSNAPAAPRTKSPTPFAVPEPLPSRATYLEALAQYERGLEALQKHDYAIATEHLRQVITRYPEERELQERARLYLNVCQQRLGHGPLLSPASVEERVFAATLAINAGRHNEAYDHLRQVERENPEHDYAQYLAAVVFSARGELESALEHLRKAIVLNPENRGRALTDGDLAALRAHEGFRAVLDSIPAGTSRRRARVRR